MIFNGDHAQAVLQGGFFEIDSHVARALCLGRENRERADKQRGQKLRDASHAQTPLNGGYVSVEGFWTTTAYFEFMRWSEQCQATKRLNLVNPVNPEILLRARLPDSAFYRISGLTGLTRFSQPLLASYHPKSSTV
jgi:hypothetical protein